MKDVLNAIIDEFSVDDAQRVKEIESKTNHDVKAVEYWLRQKLEGVPGAGGSVVAFIHFACTSEDINNLAHGLMLVDARRDVLSPALAAELDRVVSETREALEQEFQKRLQSAVREAESASRQAAEAEQEQAVREARETTKNQVTEELNEQFKKTLEQTTSALKSEASTELARVQEQLDQFRIFADAQKLLGEATSQPEILARFLKMTEPFAPALAVLAGALTPSPRMHLISA